MSDLELKYAHLSNQNTPKRRANRQALQEHVEEIWAEQELENAKIQLHGPRLQLAPRYAGGRP